MFKPNRYFDENLQTNKNEEYKPLMNWDIKYPKVRVIDDLGENLGVFITKEAIGKAKEKGLDLIEINKNSNPPVCKIMDIGKYIYEVKKHKKETTQKAPEQKEIRLSPSIGEHDLIIKSNKVKEFLSEGSKVTIQFKLKGREAKKVDIIRSVVNKFYNLLKDYCEMNYNGESYILIPKH